VIIVDEPASGQDYKQSIEIMKFLTKLTEENGHPIITTHDMPIVARYARRVVVIGLGKVIADGSPQEVFRQPEVLAQTYIEPPQITQFAQAVSTNGFSKSILTVQEMYEQFRTITEQS